ncbi:MAG: hypothetical protein GX058_06570 [Firmicutes bacterium]|nr:hypothetical protein [Bacillota bacterium]
MKGSTWISLFLLVALGVVGYMWFAATNQPNQVARDIDRTGDQIGNDVNQMGNDNRTGQLSDVTTIDYTGKNAKSCTECHKPGGEHSLSKEANAVQGHPKVSGDDYASCIRCHGGDKDYAFKFILHTGHLKEGSHFISNYGGQCTVCHQMQQNGKIIVKT